MQQPKEARSPGASSSRLLATLLLLGCCCHGAPSNGDPAAATAHRSRSLLQAPAAPPSNCALDVGGARLNFSACTPVALSGREFSLMWSLFGPHPNGTATLAVGLQAPAGGWAAVGFPAEPGRMLGATVLVLKACPGCAAGAATERGCRVRGGQRRAALPAGALHRVPCSLPCRCRPVAPQVQRCWIASRTPARLRGCARRASCQYGVRRRPPVTAPCEEPFACCCQLVK